MYEERLRKFREQMSKILKGMFPKKSVMAIDCLGASATHIHVYIKNPDGSPKHLLTVPIQKNEAKVQAYARAVKLAKVVLNRREEENEKDR